MKEVRAKVVWLPAEESCRERAEQSLERELGPYRSQNSKEVSGVGTESAVENRAVRGVVQARPLLGLL